MRLFNHYWCVISISSLPELFYFGTNQSGTANTRFQGTLTVIGGSGPYRGATGTGTMNGFRKSALGSPVQLSFSVTVQQR